MDTDRATSGGPVVETSGNGRRGALRIYLGAAPGVGKTYAMLSEGSRRATRGTDVVVGLVETHGRTRTAELLEGLEIVPRRKVVHRGRTFEEMDVDAILARRPELALVDELAHTNVPGSRHAKRWQDIEELLDAGVDVVSTVNIQHLESVNDVVERITGVVQRETVPDEVVRAAEQVELVDMTPEALRRRMAHGNIYASAQVDAALSNYFRPGNLSALRELALLWVADQVDTALEEYRERHGITQPWETRERVVVAITGAPSTEQLLRRASRIASRAHGDLIGVHVRSDDGLASMATAVEQHQLLLEQLGGRYLEVAGSDIAAALVDVAHAENATQLVLGASQRSRWAELVRGSVINRVIRLSGPIDVHVISPSTTDPNPGSHETSGARRPPRPGQLPPRRRQLGWVTAAVSLLVLTLVLYAQRDDVGLSTVLLLYLAVVVATAAIGGAAPALAAAVAGFLLANWYFTPPEHDWTVAEAENLLALVVFLAVAGVVSRYVGLVARRSKEASRAAAEAETLARLAGSVAETDPLPVLIAHLRSSFGLEGAALLRRQGSTWTVEASDGPRPPTSPEEATVAHDLGQDLVLALTGRQLAAQDRRLLNAFAAQLAAALDRRALSTQARRADALADADALRSALLQAVSHDLRTPLAGIKASASSLRQKDIAWTPEQVDEFIATIDDETDRLTVLVTNLLDMSRIQAGAVAVAVTAVGLEEVIPGAVSAVGADRRAVRVDLPDLLPEVNADPVLLERVVANLVDNAVAHAPLGTSVRVEAGAVAGRVDLRVIDQGPGIPDVDRERIFEPFQRSGDATRSAGAGVGLGLAVARGFTEAMGGQLVVEDTPGGGTTMVVELEAAP